MKILERKTGLEGTASKITKNELTTYEIVLPGKDIKVVAESTFKRNYKKIDEEVAATEVIEDGGNQMEQEVIVVEEQIKDMLNNKLDNNTIEMTINAEAIEEPIIVEELKEEKLEEAKIEVVLTEEEEKQVKEAMEQISSVINALSANKVIIEKNSRNAKLTVDTAKMVITLDYNNSLMDQIVESLKENLNEKIELEYINQQKRSNPAAFKARGVKITDTNGIEITYKTRNDAMIWITKEFEEGRLDKKPTYYQVKKAIENNLEYLGYKWEESNEINVEAALEQ